MKTKHRVKIGNSQNLKEIENESVNLIVTSPPYPMIEMWDEIMASQNDAISGRLQTNPDIAFELMHQELDSVWKECHRVLKPGGFLCINIGDATRTINDNFKLYNNHSRITKACLELGLIGLPNILWRKQTNSPNKFMGSGMLPCGAYVTLEHEWILIFRKGNKRIYKTAEDKLERMKSSFFWEERNIWFSDVWDVKGVKQTLQKSNSRERSAAYPFDIPYRLINMFSQKGDIVLDPFLGTGTTIKAAILTGRNSEGYEIDANFEAVIREGIRNIDIASCNSFIKRRLDMHHDFVEKREASGKEFKYMNNCLNCKVMTKQELNLELNYLHNITLDQDTGGYIVEYGECSELRER